MKLDSNNINKIETSQLNFFSKNKEHVFLLAKKKIE